MSPARRPPVRVALFGAGGNSPSIVEAILAVNAAAAAGPVYEIIGYFDDLPENRNAAVLGFPVLGTIEEARDAPGGCRFVNGIASVESFRRKPEIIARSGVAAERFETIVHPRAVIATSAKLGRGTAILANSVVCAKAVVGDHVIVLEGSTLNHHSHTGDFATISAGVTVLGRVRVGAGAFIGGGASVAPGIVIGDSALVGMGATVIRDVENGTVVAGSPARVLASSTYAAKKPI